MHRLTKESMEKIRSAHPIDFTLFGALGATTAEICQDISRGFAGKQFEFMDHAEFEALVPNLSAMNLIYWKEILFRIYSASALNILRHRQWQNACICAFRSPGNLIAFAAGMRGLLEGAQDVCYSLGSIPLSLAQNRPRIESALTGNMRDMAFVIDGFEDRLIHFVYGRKIGKTDGEIFPNSHVAKEPKDYRNAIGLPEEQRELFRQLYDHLCGICHPTTFSLAHFLEAKTNGFRITPGKDETYILALCRKYESVISLSLSLSITLSAVCLKALNWFPLPEVKCIEVEKWNFDNVIIWRKAQAAATGSIM